MIQFIVKVIMQFPQRQYCLDGSNSGCVIINTSISLWTIVGREKHMKILLLMANGVEMLEASAFIDVFGWYRTYGDGDIEVITCGLEKKIVTTFNIPLEVDMCVDEVKAEDYDALAIPGGFGTYGFYEDAYSEPVQNLISTFHTAHKWIASICVGALPIGKSGILKGRKATTYHLMDKQRQAQLAAFDVEIIDAPVVVDDKIITSWCPSTAVEVAFELLQQLAGETAASSIRYLMGF